MTAALRRIPVATSVRTVDLEVLAIAQQQLCELDKVVEAASKKRISWGTKAVLLGLQVVVQAMLSAVDGRVREVTR